MNTTMSIIKGDVNADCTYEMKGMDGNLRRAFLAFHILFRVHPALFDGRLDAADVFFHVLSVKLGGFRIRRRVWVWVM